jgi:hypothetical protein
MLKRASLVRSSLRLRPNIGRLSVFVATLLLSFAYFLPAWLNNPANSWVGDAGDPEQNQWFLAWVPYALGHGLNPFVTKYLLYPSGGNLMWNTSSLLVGFLVSPLTVLFGPTVAYNVVLLFAPPFAALAAFCAFRRWTSPIAAAVGGVAFGLCPFFFRQAEAHLHLVVLVFVPLMLLALDEVIVRQQSKPWRAGVMLAIAALGQFFVAEELFAFDVLVAGIGVVILVACYWRRVRSKLRYAANAAAIAVLAFLAVAAYPIWVQFRGPQQATDTIHLPGLFVDDLANTIVPVGQFLANRADYGLGQPFTGNSGEWNGYIGIPLLLAIVIVAIWGWRHRGVRFWVAMFVVVTVVSFGPTLHVNGKVTDIWLPWQLVTHLPLTNSALPNRLDVYADLFAALLLALFIDRLRRAPTLVVVGGWTLTGLAVLSWVPAIPYTTTVAQPAYFSSGGGVHGLPDGSVALVLPYVTGEENEHSELWVARAGLPVKLIEGYLIVPGPHAGPHGFSYEAFASIGKEPAPLSPDVVSSVLQEWLDEGVQTVIVGPSDYDQKAVAGLVSQVLNGEQPQWEQGVAVFKVDGDSPARTASAGQ